MKGFLLIKPDYLKDTETIVELAKSIIRERKLQISVVKVPHISKITREFITQFYEQQRTALHFPIVVNYWTNKPTSLILLDGEDIFADTFKLAGAQTDPYNGNPGELRYEGRHLIAPEYREDSNQRKLRNIVHRSDSDGNRTRELALLERLIE